MQYKDFNEEKEAIDVEREKKKTNKGQGPQQVTLDSCNERRLPYPSM